MWLWLAWVLVLSVFGQGHPDIVWMQRGHFDWVRSVSFAADGSMLASTSGDNTIRLWRVSDGALLRTLTGHAASVNSVAFSPDGNLIALGSSDHIVRLWRVSDGALLQTYDQETGTRVRSVRFSPNGRQFGYGRDDATVLAACNPFWQNGDVNGDGCVNDVDLLLVRSAFGQNFSGVEDLNADGIVDDADLNVVLFNFGSGC